MRVTCVRSTTLSRCVHAVDVLLVMQVFGAALVGAKAS